MLISSSSTARCSPSLLFLSFRAQHYTPSFFSHTSLLAALTDAELLTKQRTRAFLSVVAEKAVFSTLPYTPVLLAIVAQSMSKSASARERIARHTLLQAFHYSLFFSLYSFLPQQTSRTVVLPFNPQKTSYWNRARATLTTLVGDGVSFSPLSHQVLRPYLFLHLKSKPHFFVSKSCLTASMRRRSASFIMLGSPSTVFLWVFVSFPPSRESKPEYLHWVDPTPWLAPSQMFSAKELFAKANYGEKASALSENTSGKKLCNPGEPYFSLQSTCSPRSF